MSEELTKQLQRLARSLDQRHASGLSLPRALLDGVARQLRAAADLIESQHARIEELERIVRTYAVMTRTQGLGLSESDAALLASLAASPDTPETRPERCAWCGDAVPEGDGVRQVSLGTIFHSGCTPTDWPCGAFIGDPETRPLQRACVSCGGTGQDSTAVALERLGAVLPLRCGECGGSGLVDPEEGR